MSEAERWREARTIYGRADLPKVVKAGDALAAALEARDRRVVELEAGLRDAADYLEAASVAADDHGDAVFSSDLHRAARIARDLLAGRAAGGEG